MGLDQWMYLCRKCTDGEMKQVRSITANSADINDVDSNILITEKTPESTESLESILNLCQIVTLPTKEINATRLKQAYGIPLEWVETGSQGGPGYLKLTYRPPAENGFANYDAKPKHIDTTWEEIDEKFSDLVHRDFYVFYRKEEYYWRKNYDIQEIVSSHVPIINCGFHALPREALLEMMDADEDFRPPMLRDGEVLCYHPWW